MLNTDKNHVHTYDAQGKMTCCSLEEKIYTKANAKELLHQGHNHEDDLDEEDDDDHDHNHGSEGMSAWKQYLPAIISFTMLIIGILLDNYIKQDFFKGYIRLAWYLIAYLPVGLPVMKEAFEAILKKEFFTEFTLMVMATNASFITGKPTGK